MAVTRLEELGLPIRRTAPLGSGFVTTSRRDRRCDLCDWTIPAGDHHWSWTLSPWMWGEDGWWTAHVHAICDVIFYAWVDDLTETMPEPGHFREVLGEVAEASARHVEWAS